MNKPNKLTIKQAVLIIFLMGLAWLISPAQCSSESCAYTATIAGLFTFGLMIVAAVFILNYWVKFFGADNGDEFRLIDFIIFVLLTIIYIVQCFAM